MTERMRILLGIEIPSEAKETAEILREQYPGADVRTAVDGLETYLLARSFAPQLVIVSAYLERVDGIVLARTLRSAPQFAGTRVVLILDGMASDRVREALEVRPSSFLIRPFGRDSLVQRTEEAMRAPAPQRGARAPAPR
jgi:PleD family two-component response regulator